MYWLIRVEIIVLIAAIGRLIWVESGQVFEKEKDQLRQQLIEKLNNFTY